MTDSELPEPHKGAVAKRFRVQLKKAFPKTTFMVTSNRHRWSSEIRVLWIGGPSQEEVQAELGTDYAGLVLDHKSLSSVEELEVHPPDEIFVPKQRSSKGRLMRDNTFVLGMYPGEKPLLQIRQSSPFEALLRVVPDDEHEDEEDLSPRMVTSLSPSGSKLQIYSVAALVMADNNGFNAGEIVWIGRTIATVLEQTDRVLASRGDGLPLLPVTSALLSLF
jgi:hypothetical protein